MKNLLKKARIEKGLKTREVAQSLKIDQALISKFESVNRKPTREQITKLALLYELDFETVMIAWYKEKILSEIEMDIFAIKAIHLIQEELQKNYLSVKKSISNNLQLLLNEIDLLHSKIGLLKPLNSYKALQTLELEYTFESNRIDGNTLTHRETELVINEGLNISGKSMREHLEAINHQEAIEHLKNLTKKCRS